MFGRKDVVSEFGVNDGTSCITVMSEALYLETLIVLSSSTSKL